MLDTEGLRAAHIDYVKSAAVVEEITWRLAAADARILKASLAGDSEGLKAARQDKCDALKHHESGKEVLYKSGLALTRACDDFYPRLQELARGLPRLAASTASPADIEDFINDISATAGMLLIDDKSEFYAVIAEALQGKTLNLPAGIPRQGLSR